MSIRTQRLFCLALAAFAVTSSPLWAHLRMATHAALPRSREAVLYDFQGGSDGAGPIADLVADQSGALYGTTASGGTGPGGGYGTVFKLTPSVSGYTESVLYRFQGGSDGVNPGAGLLLDKNGALYGTTVVGGTGGGTVFKLTPSGTTYVESILHRFAGYPDDGDGPRGDLISDRAGTLFGTTTSGGNTNNGTVFRIVMNGSGYTILHSFQGLTDGAAPSGALLLRNGFLFGTTGSGGRTTGAAGTVFELAPTGSGYTESILYAFQGGQDGKQPWGGVVGDPSGSLYGTTTFGGGSANYGTVFKLTPSQSGYSETVLHRFAGGSDGEFPYAGLARAQTGTLYGTTVGGGMPQNDGIVFALLPTLNEKVLWSFGLRADGRQAQAGLIKVGEALFGTATIGGNTNNGVVFRVRL